MGFFLSYSRRDFDAVQVLVSDLGRTRSETWLDREMGGGEDWWQEILARIRSAEVFIFAVSTNSLRSRPCMAELEYARALGVPLLPIQVGNVESFRISPVAEKQVIDYRPRLDAGRSIRPIVDSAIDLVVAATDLATQERTLPDPLPPSPAIPFEYLMQIRLAVDAEDLPARVQLQVLTQLKQALRDEEDPEARRDVIDLLQRLRRHPDTTYRNATEIDELLAHPNLRTTPYTTAPHPSPGIPREPKQLPPRPPPTNPIQPTNLARSRPVEKQQDPLPEASSWLGWVVSVLALLMLALLIALQNSEPTQVRILVFTGPAPVGLTMLLCVATGALLAAVPLGLRLWRCGRNRRTG